MVAVSESLPSRRVVDVLFRSSVATSRPLSLYEYKHNHDTPYPSIHTSTSLSASSQVQPHGNEAESQAIFDYIIIFIKARPTPPRHFP